MAKKTATKAKPRKARTAKVTSEFTDIVRKVTVGRMAKKNLPQFRPGDTVGVYVKVKEGEKERVQLYKGVVLKLQGTGTSRSFTVRKISFGVGVERTFPLYSPSIDKIEVFSEGRVRRAKLYYVRKLKGRAATIQSELLTGADVASEEIPQA